MMSKGNRCKVISVHFAVSDNCISCMFCFNCISCMAPDRPQFCHWNLSNFWASPFHPVEFNRSMFTTPFTRERKVVKIQRTLHKSHPVLVIVCGPPVWSCWATLCGKSSRQSVIAIIPTWGFFSLFCRIICCNCIKIMSHERKKKHTNFAHAGPSSTRLLMLDAAWKSLPLSAK